MTTISITIPNEYNALIHASDMLKGMATDLKITPDSVLSTLAPEPELPGTTELGAAVTKLDTPNHITDVTNPPLTDSGQVDLGLTNIELALAQDGVTKIPFSSDIHTGGKVKITKDGKWKLARNMPPAKVAAVEAELKLAMSAGTTGPMVTIPEPTPEPTPPAPPTPESEVTYLVEGNEYTAEQLHGFGWTDEQIAQCEIVPPMPEPTIVTFPELMAKFTQGKVNGSMTDEMMTTALQTVTDGKITSLPLLASQPNLVAAVYNYLFPAVA